MAKLGWAGVHVFVGAVWTAVRTPGPLRVCSMGGCARRGAQVAAPATARKLASLCGCLLTREQDYTFAQPTLTRKKIRRLELEFASGGGAAVVAPLEGAKPAHARLMARDSDTWDRNGGGPAKARQPPRQPRHTRDPR